MKDYVWQKVCAKYISSAVDTRFEGEKGDDLWFTEAFGANEDILFRSGDRG